HLIPDTYSVRVAAKGFKASEQKAVPVSADTSARVDMKVELGSAGETVEVTGEAPQLQTDRADVAVQFNQVYVENLQVFNRNFTGTAFELNGTDNQDPILGIIVVNPNLDAVTEAKVSLQNYDAEFGKAVAGVVTAQTKSGSNDIHGSAFWFRRTDALAARDPFTQSNPDPLTGRFIPSSRWQQ